MKKIDINEESVRFVDNCMGGLRLTLKGGDEIYIDPENFDKLRERMDAYEKQFNDLVNRKRD